MNSNKQAGFSAGVVVLVVLVIAVVSLVGYKVYDSSSSKDEVKETTSSQNDNPTIENAQDLEQTAEELNAQDIDAELDTSDIDAALN